MSKRAKWLIGILVVILLLEAAVVFVVRGYYLPYQNAANYMPSDVEMTLFRDEKDRLIMSWSGGVGQDRYQVQVLRDAEVLYETWTREPSCTLPTLPMEEELEISIRTARGYRFLFVKEERLRPGEGELRVKTCLRMPAIRDLTWTLDPETQTVKLEYIQEEHTTYRMYLVEEDGEQQLLHTLEGGNLTLALGEGKPIPVPEEGQTLSFAFDAYRRTPHLTYYGTVTQTCTLVREDLLQRDLKLEHQDLGDHVHSFSWSETKGDYYEVQQYDPGSDSWNTLHRVKGDEERTYTTGHLPRYGEYRFRVVAVGGQTLPDSEYAAISQDVTVKTGASPVFCTVWPIQELDVYSDAERSSVIGKAAAEGGYCVLALNNGLFKVRYADGYGYLDSNYCLIDLPEFLGDICLYDIANSYKSLYMAHEYELPTVTGKVIVGYEKVKMKSGQQLVPLLYPVALRLEKAAFHAMDQGYKLKIYDAYRPREATKALYNQAINLSDQPIPEKTYTGKVMTDLPQLAEGEILTYHKLMTDSGRYSMNYFLAAGKSRHNLGIALDLTLADLSTGKDLKMQTSMHDLSWYSENARDNKNARTLSSIMEGVGFTGLRSEWWHFNDLEVQNNMKPIHRWEGVSPECWMADDHGWRYRKDNGEYYVNCTVAIDDTTCVFDEQGYLVTESEENV